MSIILCRKSNTRAHDYIRQFILHYYLNQYVRTFKPACSLLINVLLGNQTALDLRCGALSNDLTLPDSMQVLASGVRKQFIPKRNAWVLCDECQKWRRITATLADQIEETNCGWYICLIAVVDHSLYMHVMILMIVERAVPS